MDENNKHEVPTENHVLSGDSAPHKDEEVTSHRGLRHYHNRHKSCRHHRRGHHGKSGASCNGNEFEK